VTQKSHKVSYILYDALHRASAIAAQLIVNSGDA